MTYADVVRRIAGRARLVGVIKGRADAEAIPLLRAGLRDVADNRVDALAARQLGPDVRYHFIGNVQSRDVRRLAELKPALVHSFDRVDLAAKWPREVPVLLQVDFTGRADRNGIAPDALASALAHARAHGLDVRGLSTLPPQGEDPRPHFRRLRELQDQLGLRELSMGMSADFEVAIEEGATMVRVGRALFEP